MRRGEIWTIAGGPDYAGKPRPVVLLQADAFDATASITVCLLTTDPTEAPLFRLVFEPDDQNGLKAPSRIMVDKVITVAKDRLGSRIGRMSDSDSLRLNQALAVFLGLAMSPRARSR